MLTTPKKCLMPAMLVLSGLFAMAQSSNPTAGIAFDHAARHVRDLQKSADFYDKVLGLERTPDPFRDAKHIWYRIGPHQQLHIIAGAEAVGPQDDDVHLAFRVADVAAFSAHLDRMKIAHQPFGTRKDGVKQVYFQDPDGYWVEVNDAKF